MSHYVIETHELSKQYGNETGVENVSIHVEKGKIYGLLGRNGAGKTTLIRMLMNLAKRTSGDIRIFGEEFNVNPQKTYMRIGSIIETPGFYQNLTGAENLKILTKLRGSHKRDAINSALKLVGLENETKKIFMNYSLGMKQRLGIAAAIIHEPELLILDEPINGLDPIGIHEVRNYLAALCKDKGVTIIISSHILSEIEQLADTIGVMHNGKLIEEIDMNELQLKKRKYIEFQVSDDRKATLLLEEKLGLVDYSVHEKGLIRIYGEITQSSKINRSFIENGIDVSKVVINEENLEDYFSNLIGGGQIG